MATTDIEVMRLIGLASLVRPDLVARVPPDKLREMAKDCLDVAEIRLSVPEPFRRAFEEPGR